MVIKNRLYSFIVLILIMACNSVNQVAKSPVSEELSKQKTKQTTVSTPPPVIAKPKMCLEMERMGLVEVRSQDISIRVVLPYASNDNFTGQVLYESSQYAYLQPEAAVMLAKASQLLQKQHPNYRLLVLDAARPLSVQQKMWNIVKGTPLNIYVANPKKTGLHNYGAAVDITIVNDMGVALDMGTPYDFFGEEAQPAKEEQMLKEGKLTQQQLDNRKLLRDVMNKSGFLTYNREWWHFNACTLLKAKSKYKVIP
ncbi:MAG: M15 family metallopeptidase [Bacteroidales bacterium]|jgi:D-alanyl-D-alanine dipeptidase|nr:M15 family metallopeptidase [Bacteroidales bacterium]